MVDWIVIAILYVLVLLLVRFLLGGIASAGEAMQKWGAHAGRRWQRTHPRGWR